MYSVPTDIIIILYSLNYVHHDSMHRSLTQCRVFKFNMTHQLTVSQIQIYTFSRSTVSGEHAKVRIVDLLTLTDLGII